MIKTLNLDKNFSPTFCVQIKHESFQFWGGEVHIKIDKAEYFTDVEKVIITNRFRNGDDIMKVLAAKDALERKGIKNFELVMPYVPYARQDRICAPGEAFTLKIFAQIINSAKFDKVIVFDAHSDVAPALIDRCENHTNHEFVDLACMALNSYRSESKKNLILVSPDSGANKKCNKLYESLDCFTSLVKCDKLRNPGTGELAGFEVFATDLKGDDCMIVDDICDGGRTFIGIAQELKMKNAGDIYLCVTHGIFSYGFDELKKYFKKIFTTNSFKDINDEIVKQIQIKL
jgi:ribose-phosphate pyrophosphokinase